MTRILLIRHGTVDLTGQALYGRSPGVHLNARGEREATALANALRVSRKIDEIVSSPLDRAVETARIISGDSSIPIELDDGFLEVDYGEWMGKTFHEIRGSSDWQNYNKSRSTHAPPSGEGLLAVQARAFQALERVLNRWSNRAEGATVAIVSHGDIIRGLLVLFLGMPLDHIYRLEVLPASLSEIEFDGRFPRVLRINQVFSDL